MPGEISRSNPGPKGGVPYVPRWVPPLPSDKEMGLYRKYKVERMDGSSQVGGKHEKCEYFVLDLTHDRHARTAAKAYADSCFEDYPFLAEQLIELIKKIDGFAD